MVAAQDRNLRYEERLLGTEIDRFLERSGISMRGLARRIRRPQASVGSWKRGRSLPIAKRDLRALARGLEREVSDIERLVQIDRALRALRMAGLPNDVYADVKARVRAAVEM